MIFARYTKEIRNMNFPYLSFINIKMIKYGSSALRAGHRQQRLKVVQNHVLYSLLSEVVICFVKTVSFN